MDRRMPTKPPEPNEPGTAMPGNAAFDDSMGDELPTNSLIARRMTNGTDRTAGTARDLPEPPPPRTGPATPFAPTMEDPAEPAGAAIPASRKRKRPRASTNAAIREGEAIRLWFRTERVFYQNGAWYISTREGIDVGPYEDAPSARADAKRLIQLLMQQSKTSPQSQILTIHQFMHRPRNRLR
jgi:hypothetical protein